MTQETINPVDNVDLKRKAEDELAQDATKISKPPMETAESDATLSSEQVSVPVVTEPAEEAVEASASAEEEIQEEDEEVEEEEEEAEAAEEVEPAKKTKKSKKDASSDFEDEEDLDEDDAAIDKSNIIPSGRRTRGKVIDFKALVASDDEEDEDDDE